MGSEEGETFAGRHAGQEPVGAELGRMLLREFLILLPLITCLVGYGIAVGTRLLSRTPLQLQLAVGGLILLVCLAIAFRCIRLLIKLVRLLPEVQRSSAHG